jgi:hypothetical protein
MERQEARPFATASPASVDYLHHQFANDEDGSIAPLRHWFVPYQEDRMVQFGYKLMTEEHGPSALIENSLLAEKAGFDFVSISDHFHPWLQAQGHSPFAWSVLGGNGVSFATLAAEIITGALTGVPDPDADCFDPYRFEA